MSSETEFLAEQLVPFNSMDGWSFKAAIRSASPMLAAAWWNRVSAECGIGGRHSRSLAVGAFPLRTNLRCCSATSDRRSDPLPLRCHLPWQAGVPPRSQGQPPYRERRCASPGAGRVDRPNGDAKAFLILIRNDPPFQGGGGSPCGVILNRL